MTTPRIDQGKAIVAELTSAGVRATIDPGEAETNRPCVLVPPPTVDYQAGTMAGPALTWRLFALSSHATGTLAAWGELDGLLEDVAQLVTVEVAEPLGYVLTPATGPVPAYSIRFTT